VKDRPPRQALRPRPREAQHGARLETGDRSPRTSPGQRGIGATAWWQEILSGEYRTTSGSMGRANKEWAAKPWIGESRSRLSVMEIDIRTCLGTICRLTGSPATASGMLANPVQPRRCLVTTRAEALFGFRAHTPFERGLRRTIERYGPTFGTRPSEARRA
jgi:hypothetical protein